jgi:hypothetical protein
MACAKNQGIRGQIEAYTRNCNEERQRLVADSISARAKLEAKRTRVESGRQRNIDPVVKQIIGEDDARARIAELKVQRLQIESSSQHLGRFMR